MTNHIEVEMDEIILTESDIDFLAKLFIDDFIRGKPND